MDNNDFIKDWMEGKISPDELKKRKESGDTSLEQFEEIITRTAGMKVPEKTSKEEAWQKLSAKLTETTKPEAKVVKMNRWIPLSIAASLTLIAITIFTLTKTTVSTQMAETKLYLLPDGSEVTLNADSKITFSKTGWSSERTVKLEGEAFFKVIKGSTFTVETASGAVTVLGTSFNVQARQSTFEVSCFTGRVRVSSDNAEVILTKGQFTKRESKGLTAVTAFDDGQATWREGDFYFEQQPLTDVIAELERQFDIEIVYHGDEARLYTGYFNKKNVDEALDLVFKPMSLNYRKENRTIIVE